MHKRLVFSIISRVVFIVCVFLLLPLAWAAYDNVYSLETNAFVVVILAGLLCAVLGRSVFLVKEKDFELMNAKDALAAVGLTWIFLSLWGALPLWLSQVVPTFTDAFFEIASGLTTTGASIFTDIEILPRGILFWRSLTHWLGGMGVVVLFVALLPSLGYNAYHLYKAETPGVTSERILPRIKETARILWEVYLLLSVAQTFLLMQGGLSFFDATCHTFGTMATGGFSTRNISVAAFSPFVQWVIAVFMVFAGVNFLLHVQMLRGRPFVVFRNEEFRVYAGLIIVLVPVFAFFLWQTHAVDAPLRHAAFQVVSILTTTGYVTTDFNLWPHALRFSLVLLMFIGGCGGSTGGGMKVSRVVLSLKIAKRSIQQGILPNIVAPIRFNGRALSQNMVFGVAVFFVLYVMLFFAGTAILLVFENCDIVTALSASIASLSNIGPGLNMVGATQNYAWMSVPSKWTCIILMLAGRLELYAILALFLPATWKK